MFASNGKKNYETHMLKYISLGDLSILTKYLGLGIFFIYFPNDKLMASPPMLFADRYKYICTYTGPDSIGYLSRCTSLRNQELNTFVYRKHTFRIFHLDDDDF